MRFLWSNRQSRSRRGNRCHTLIQIGNRLLYGEIEPGLGEVAVTEKCNSQKDLVIVQGLADIGSKGKVAADHQITHQKARFE